ncbi:thymic stromal cotransporter homolog [Adelges cooleyi]|uniref:thymic stromal cotransporter homolog n=1 Tax=Adelges cooleyi TaxID=133065 RepID=UPI0021805A9F|nr:thymic stromal cotransporter homolog [Adelges cooleyi]XP_050422787.1 thymic stromal cotransporter homolog [Adelges cooleyi]XP_050422788.1 thymic stromal cotransporter homolog [Adelges cooleyi]
MADNVENNHVSEKKSKWQTLGPCGKAKLVLRSIHVEPLVICFIISRVLLILATQNLSLQKACKVNLKLSNESCLAIENPTGHNATKADEVKTQQLVAEMFIWQLIIQSSVPCIFAIFVGSWSDRNRKRVPCMLMPICGELVRNIGLLLCVYYFFQLPMEIVGLVEAIPTSITGGKMVMFNALYSYIGDVTKAELKTFRIGLVTLLTTVGLAIGTSLSGITFRDLGFYGVYGISSALYIIALVYGLLFLKEVSAKVPEGTEPPKKTGIALVKDFFDAKHIETAFQITFKDGPHNRKLRIIMLMVIVFLVMGPINGDVTVQYLNTRVRFNWNEVTFSMFLTYSTVTSVIGTILCIALFSHILKIDDGLIGFVACLGKLVSGVIYAFAPSEWVYCIGPLIDIMGGAVFITTRSIMTKLVKPDELGQVTSIYGIVETLVPIIYGPLYSAVYKATVNTLPGTYSLIGSTLAIPGSLIFLWMYRQSKKAEKSDYAAVKTEEDKAEEMQSL